MPTVINWLSFQATEANRKQMQCKAITQSPFIWKENDITVILCSTDVRVIWAGGRTNPPLDKPKCGWENELCIEQDRQGKTVPSETTLFVRVESLC